MKVEILESEDIKIPQKYRGIIVSEIMRIIPSIRGNKNYDLIKVHNINIRYMDKSMNTCSESDAVTISIILKYDKHDCSKGEYSLRGSSHAGIQVFLPRKIRKRRDTIISEIIGND